MKNSTDMLNLYFIRLHLSLSESIMRKAIIYEINMTKNKRICFFFSLFTLLFSPLTAIADIGDCGNLVITITNTTEQPCQLMSTHIAHGHVAYFSALPKSVSPYSSSPPLTLSQPFIGSGPDITMHYSCGKHHRISLHTKQNYCFTAAGNISTRAFNAENLSANSTAKKGDALWDQAGHVSWTLRSPNT